VLHPRASSAFAEAAIWPYVLLLVGSYGSEDAETAKITVNASRERERLVMIRDAFHRQGPFVGSGGHYNPGPATAAPLLAMWRPLNDDLSPPWALRRSSPVLAVRPTRDVTLRSMRLPTVSSADLRSELGLRSLDPDRPFWSAFAELIRGQTSPTDFCNCTYDVRATQPGLLILAGTEASTSFLFFNVLRPCLATRVTRGEPRSVRSC
jgi:hypothetical protein